MQILKKYTNYFGKMQLLVAKYTNYIRLIQMIF